MQVPEKSVCLHAAFRQSLSLFLFFAAAGSLDKEEQSKPLLWFKKKKRIWNSQEDQMTISKDKGKMFEKVFFFLLIER